MKGESRGGKAQLFANATGRHPIRAGLYEATVNLEPARLRQRCECFYGLCRFHISRIMESITACQSRLMSQPVLGSASALPADAIIGETSQ